MHKYTCKQCGKKSSKQPGLGWKTSSKKLLDVKISDNCETQIMLKTKVTMRGNGYVNKLHWDHHFTVNSSNHHIECKHIQYLFFNCLNKTGKFLNRFLKQS